MDRKNEEHLDLRQRKTRTLLVKALAELMEERPFSELSVVDICSRAMVHRTTFYAHFNDKRELLSYLLSQLERECVETCLPKEEMTSPKAYFLYGSKKYTGVLSGPPLFVPGLFEQRDGRRGPRSVRPRSPGTVPSAVQALFPGCRP